MSDYYPRTIIGVQRPKMFSKMTPLGNDLCPEAFLAEAKKALGLLRDGYEALPARPVRAMKRFFRSAMISSNIVINANIHGFRIPGEYAARLEELHEKAVNGMGKAAKILLTHRILRRSKRSLGFSGFSDKIYS